MASQPPPVGRQMGDANIDEVCPAASYAAPISRVSSSQPNIGGNGRIPPGPAEKYRSTQELFDWMSDQFKRFGNIYKASIYGDNAYVVTDPAYAEHVLIKNWQNYVKKGPAINRVTFLVGNGLIVSEGEFWKRQRRLIQPAFHRKSVDGLTALIVNVNAALLDRWENAAKKNECVNVTRDVSDMILEVVLRSIFGEDYEQVRPRFKIVTEVAARNLEFALAFRSLRKIVLDVVIQRRKDNSCPNDILGMLMNSVDPESGRAMMDHELVTEVMTLIVAGHETTATTLNWIWYLISQHPDVDEKLSREVRHLPESNFLAINDLSKFIYTRQVIDESLRLYPALWLMARRAVKDDQLGQYFVPAGTDIYISPYFIQRHPDLWEHPDRFDPDRFSVNPAVDRPRRAMLPFSAGPRNCIGELLARVEIQIHLMMIAKRLRLRYVQTQPLEFEAGVNLRSKSDFIMTPERKRDRRTGGGVT
jgi:cytochrome P450